MKMGTRKIILLSSVIIILVVLALALCGSIYLLKPRKAYFSNPEEFSIEKRQIDNEDVIIVDGNPFNALFNEFRFYCYEVKQGEIEISLYYIIGFPFINEGIKEVRPPILLKNDFFISEKTDLVTVGKKNNRILLGKVIKDKNNLILTTPLSSPDEPEQ